MAGWRVLKMDGGYVYTTLLPSLMPLSCKLENGYDGQFYDTYILSL